MSERRIITFEEPTRTVVVTLRDEDYGDQMQITKINISNGDVPKLDIYTKDVVTESSR